MSLTYFDADVLAIVVHGSAEMIEFEDADFAELDSAFLAVYGGTPSTRAENSV